MNGILVVNKPENMTSHDVVYKIRKLVNREKTGHGGTLDPMATGVLPITIGRATKIVPYMDYGEKRYTCKLTLGIETDTQDIWGKVLKTSDASVSQEAIIKAVEAFRGDIQQTPPMFSAIKIKGKKLYEYAREGKTIEVPSRKVTIYRLEILDIQDKEVTLDVTCSKGTYIRTLCHDIGLSLGTYGTLSQLCRTAVGKFELKDAIDLEQLNEDNVASFLLPTDEAIGFLPAIEIKQEVTWLKLRNGGQLSLNDPDLGVPRSLLENDEDSQLCRLYYEDIFVAVADINQKNKRIKSKKLFFGI